MYSWGCGGVWVNGSRRLLAHASSCHSPRPPSPQQQQQAHDVTSQDPRLLVHLKAYRNTVPVPRHWCQKRKYLQGKRGIEKPPFELPGALSSGALAGLGVDCRSIHPEVGC